MVDRESRIQAISVLKRLALGRSTSYDSENILMDLCATTSDPIIYALFKTVFEIGGDCDESLACVFSKGSKMRKRICRWILFLKTDLKYEWPKERLAPGIKDFYKPNWFDKLFGLDARIMLSNKTFMSRGDYQVWPFFRQSDLEGAKEICRNRLLSQGAK